MHTDSYKYVLNCNCALVITPVQQTEAMATKAKKPKFDPELQVKTEIEVLQVLDSTLEALKHIDLDILRETKLKSLNGKLRFTETSWQTTKCYTVLSVLSDHHF